MRLDGAGAIRHRRTGLLLTAILGSTSAGGLPWGIARCEPQAEPQRLEKEIVVTAARPADAAMAARVAGALQHNPYIFADHVTVTVENGIVRVGGVVQDLSDLYAILREARRIAGRRRVVNEIEYQPVDDDGN
jgi:hypothetical protein